MNKSFNRMGIEVTVVGSHARGTANANSDWDYVLNGGKPNKISNLLPGGCPVRLTET